MVSLSFKEMACPYRTVLFFGLLSEPCHSPWRRFAQCCKNGFDAALRLVSKCSGVTVSALESKYRTCCADGTFGQDWDDVLPEEDLLEQQDVFGKGDAEKCADLLKDCKAEADLIRTEEPRTADIRDVPGDLKGMPDEEQFKTVVNAQHQGDEKIGGERLSTKSYKIHECDFAPICTHLYQVDSSCIIFLCGLACLWGLDLCALWHWCSIGCEPQLRPALHTV